MRRLIFWMAVAAALVAIACGGGGIDGDEGPTTQPTTTPTTVATPTTQPTTHPPTTKPPVTPPTTRTVSPITENPNDPTGPVNTATE